MLAVYKTISRRHRGRCTNFTKAFGWYTMRKPFGYAELFEVRDISKCSRHSLCNLLYKRSPICVIRVIRDKTKQVFSGQKYLRKGL